MPNLEEVHVGPTYFVWADSDKRVATSTKIKQAVARYTTKYGQPPPEVLVNEADATARSDVPLRGVRFVNPNLFYLPIPDT
jgi:hypothetical protein